MLSPRQTATKGQWSTSSFLLFFCTPRDNTRRYVLLYRHIASIYTKHGRAIKDIKEKQEIVGNAKQR
jgi:hypothetical protein